MYGYIYETTNLINGKKYIGQHKAKEFDINYIGSGNLLLRAIQKYGRNNFSTQILESINDIPTICSSIEELNSSEKYYIDFYNCIDSDQYYNIAPGGNMIDFDNVKITPHAPWNKGLTAESDERVKYNTINRINTMISRYGSRAYILTDDQQKRAAQNRVGRIVSSETRKKISNAHKGKPSPLKGRKFPERIGLNNHKKDYKPSETAWKNSVQKRQKKVICLETNEIFESIESAGRWLGYKSGNSVSDCCHNLSFKSCKGFTFRFVDK